MITGFRAPLVVVLGVVSVAWAQAPMQQVGEDIPPGLYQKQLFVKGLVEDQAVSNRIQASEQAEAKRLFELALDRYSKALVALQAKDFGKAENLFNDAMSAIGKARRLVPDTEGLIAQQRAEYEKTLDRVESLEKSYLSYVKRVRLQPDAAGTESENQVSLGINKYLDSAKSQAEAGHWNNALQEAQKANFEMQYQMGRILGLMAVEYIKKFDTPAEELAYEIERNRNLLDLIPVVVSEMLPSEDIKSTIEDLKEQNRAVMDLEKEYERLRDYRKALIYAHAGITYLEVALTSAGLIMPQASEAR